MLIYSPDNLGIAYTVTRELPELYMRKNENSL